MDKISKAANLDDTVELGPSVETRANFGESGYRPEIRSRVES